MSQATAPPMVSDHRQLEKLCTAIRGKLQFMDYLVRAAVADLDRFQDETDAGTRIFIRQLIEMHATNLANESNNMRLVNDFQTALEGFLEHPETSLDHGDVE